MFFIIASLAVFLTFAVRAYRNRNNFTGMSAILATGISVAITILAFPYYYNNNQNMLFAILGSVRYGISAIALGANKDVTDFFNTGGTLSTIYVALLYFYYILGPVSASAFVFSFARNLFEALKLKGHKVIHVFSSLNPETVAIAESIAKNREKERVLFCSTGLSQDSALAERAMAAGALSTSNSINTLKLLKKQKYEFYCMEENRDACFDVLTALCEHLAKNEKLLKQNITVRYPASSSSLELIREIDRAYGSIINLRPVDIYASQATGLLRQYGDVLIGKEHKHLMIIGAGELGEELLRMGASHLIEPGSTYEIHVVDKDAKRIASSLKARCPEVLNLDASAYFSNDHDPKKNYDVVFHSADVSSGEFITALEEAGEPDLVFINTGNDELNYLTSKTVMRTYGRRNSDMSYPQIAARIRSTTLRNSLSETEGIYYFGDFAELYDIDNLILPQLEKAAKRVHLTYLAGAYKNIFDMSEAEQEKILEETGFYNYANQDSSFNEALSMEFKYRYILSMDKEEKGNEFVREWLSNDTNLIALADMEHQRWNTYQRFQGWVKEDPSQEEKMSERTGGKKLKNDDLLIHPALVELSELKEAEERADRMLEKYNPSYSPVRYVELDRDMCRNMLLILDEE